MASRFPALLLLIAVVLGIAIANCFNLPPTVWFVMAVAASVAGVWLYAKRSVLPATISLLVALAGISAFHYALRYQTPGVHDLSHFVEDRPEVRLFGEISDWPDIRANRIELKIEVDSIIKEGRVIETEGAALLKITDTSNVLQRGDRVDLNGRLYPRSSIRPSGRFDYGRYLNLKGVRALVYLPTVLDVRVDRRSRLGFYNLVDRIRTGIVHALNRNLEPTEAALARGFLIGETRNISPEIYKMFRDSGTLHLLAVSGSNVSLVLLFIHFVLRPFGVSRRRKGMALLLTVLLFTQLAYGEPSVVRAAVMASLIILAGLLERRYDLNHIIATAALIILLVDPAQMFDVGFQLSFITAWGLILTGPILTRALGHRLKKWYGWIITLAVMSFAAQLFSLPIIAYQFEQVPAISIVANMLIIPLVSVGVIGILAVLIGHLILPTLGLFVGSLVNPILALVVNTLRWLGGEEMIVWQTGQMLTGPMAIVVVLLAYGILVAVVLAMSHPGVRRPAVIFSGVALNLIVFTGLVQAMKSEDVSVLVNPIPSGVAVAVRSGDPGEIDLIISGCRSGSYSLRQSVLKPWLDRHKIERVKRLFILEGGYDCLPDLLRLAIDQKTDTIFVYPGLQPAVGDHLARLEDHLAWVVVPLTEGNLAPDSSGIWLTRAGLLLKGPDLSLLVSRQTPEKAVETLLDSQLGVSGLNLIYPGRWQPTPDSWRRLDQVGLARIICSDIEQQFPVEVDLPDLSPDQVLPELAVDLRQLGPIMIDRQSGQLSSDL